MDAQHCAPTCQTPRNTFIPFTGNFSSCVSADDDRVKNWKVKNSPRKKKATGLWSFGEKFPLKSGISRTNFQSQNHTPHNERATKLRNPPVPVQW